MKIGRIELVDDTGATRIVLDGGYHDGAAEIAVLHPEKRGDIAGVLISAGHDLEAGGAPRADVDVWDEVRGERFELHEVALLTADLARRVVMLEAAREGMTERLAALENLLPTRG